MEITITSVESQSYMKQIRLPGRKITKTIYWRYPSNTNSYIQSSDYQSQKQLTYTTTHRPTCRRSRAWPYRIFHRLIDIPQSQENSSSLSHNHIEPISINITDII